MKPGHYVALLTEEICGFLDLQTFAIVVDGFEIIPIINNYRRFPTPRTDR